MAQSDSLIAMNAVSFMIALRKIDKKRLAVRDVVFLWFVRQFPGSMGTEIADKMNLEFRTNARQNVTKLEKCGYLEDRRSRKIGAVPNILYITPTGEEFLDGLLAS